MTTKIEFFRKLLGKGLVGAARAAKRFVKDRKERGSLRMVVYEFYRRVPGGEDRLIGVLPERRKDQERVTHQSIMNWAKLLVPEQIFKDEVYFIRVDGK